MILMLVDFYALSMVLNSFCMVVLLVEGINHGC